MIRRLLPVGLFLLWLWVTTANGFLSPVSLSARPESTIVLQARKNKKTAKEERSRKRDRWFGGFFSSSEEPKEPEEESSSGLFSVFRRNKEEEDEKKKESSEDGNGPLSFLRQRDKEPAEGRSVFGAFGGGGKEEKLKEDDESPKETPVFRGFAGPKKEEISSQPVSPKDSKAPPNLFGGFGGSEEKEKEEKPSKTRPLFSSSPSPKEENRKDTRQSKDESPVRRPAPSKPKKGKEEKESKSSTGTSVFSMMMDKLKGREKEKWIQVFPKTRIMPGESVPVTVGGIDLLVVASLDGRSLYCIANSCPHLGTPLETGTLTRLPKEESAKTDAELSKLVLSETTVSDLLSQDGCEDCIVCPLHKTAFALKSGEVRGEWCPYPPVLGNIVGAVKKKTPAAVFEVRTRGKFVEVRLNTLLEEPTNTKS